jgi:hypothetical protein
MVSSLECEEFLEIDKYYATYHHLNWFDKQELALSMINF